MLHPNKKAGINSRFANVSEPQILIIQEDALAESTKKTINLTAFHSVWSFREERVGRGIGASVHCCAGLSLCFRPSVCLIGLCSGARSLDARLTAHFLAFHSDLIVLPESI